MKFLTDSQESMVYCDPANADNWDKYPYIIMNGCNIPPEVDYQCWWENLGKKTVQSHLVAVRNDRLKELKWSYFGKKKV